nr:leptomycin b resistance protein pmd1 [Quercus suber]
MTSRRAQGSVARMPSKITSTHSSYGLSIYSLAVSSSPTSPIPQSPLLLSAQPAPFGKYSWRPCCDERFDGDRINQGTSDKLVQVIQSVAMFFSAFIVAVVSQWKLALITMTCIPAIIVIFVGGIALDAAREIRILTLYSQANVLAQEALSSIKTVHAFWAQDKMIRSYDGYLEMAHKEGDQKSPTYGVLYSVQYFAVLAGTALSYWQGFRMYQSGEISSAGTVFTVVLSVTIAATAISTLLPQMQSITNAASAAAELFSIFDGTSLMDPFSGAGDQPLTCEGDIEIRKLSFAYPSRPGTQVLHELDLSIPAGRTTALVGASGCGKSTLVGLLERWYEPSSGEILLDGKDLTTYNTQWLRSRIRLVQQEPVLFRGTVFENVAKGFVGEQLDLPLDRQMALVVQACKSSNAHDFIGALPLGYHTQVGERASMISGGQKQRLAIARSIISDPKILLLDEATSALDPHAEGMVQDALDKVSKDKTTLVIAHKLSTIKAADNIVVMAYGKILEQGTHAQLLATDGAYAALVRAQHLGGESESVETSEVEEEYELEQDMSLQDIKPADTPPPGTSEAPASTTGTANYSLIRSLFLMFSESKEVHFWILLSCVACLVAGGTYPAQALLFSRLLTVFTLPISEGRSQADFLALMLFIVALANLFAYFTIGWCCNTISQTTTHRYRREMFGHILNLNQDFFDLPENSSGALASKLSSVPHALQEIMASNLFLMMIVIVNVLACSILAIAYGWKLGLVMVFGGMPLLLGSGFARIRLEQHFDKDTGDRFASSAALATEAVLSIRTVASLTLEAQVCNQYAAEIDQIAKTAVFKFALTMIGYALSQSLDFLIMALGLWYGSRLLANGEYNETQFFVIFIAVIFGGQAAGQFFGYSTSINKAKNAANYILWLRSLKAGIREDESNADQGPEGNGAIQVEDVEFRYSQRAAARVLCDINLTIPPGSYAACVGPSGCGKSTLISLLERFYDPTAGRVTYTGQDIAKMSPRLYRASLSLVQQEPTLFQGSVRENISFGLEYQPSDDEITESCRQANALEFISSLPEGLETACGSKGLQFSGGQRQRIAIARALIRNPRVLLLDEATSALDTASERIVQQTLDEAASGRTTIAVAHRLSTIRRADVIFVFANSRIVERGTHEELQQLKGRYYEMCLAQTLDNSKL